MGHSKAPQIRNNAWYVNHIGNSIEWYSFPPLTTFLFLYPADPHGHGEIGKAEGQKHREEIKSEHDLESDMAGNSITDKVLAQIVGVAILEFGVTLHRFVSFLSCLLNLIFQ